jgi:hypothetical protein
MFSGGSDKLAYDMLPLQSGKVSDTSVELGANLGSDLSILGMHLGFDLNVYSKGSVQGESSRCGGASLASHTIGGSIKAHVKVPFVGESDVTVSVFTT